MTPLAGKHALITGGISGIGLETARQFLSEGATVAITGRSTERLDEAREELGGSVLTIPSDAGSVADQAQLATTLTTAWPKIDILVCNSADMPHLPIEQWDEKAFDAVISTNLKGPFFLVRALLPLLSPPTSIVLVGSVSAFIGHTNATVYGASKGALLSLVRHLAYELKRPWYPC